MNNNRLAWLFFLPITKIYITYKYLFVEYIW